MNFDDVDDQAKQFLKALFEKTDGDPTQQASMYDIGETLGLERDASARTAEMLMGSEFVEVRSLAGAIGLTDDGVKAAGHLIKGPDAQEGASQRLCNTPILDAASVQRVEQITTALKHQSGHLGLDYDSLTELIADLRTIDAQMASPRPKTDIIRESFRSIQELLNQAGEKDHSVRIARLIAE